MFHPKLVRDRIPEIIQAKGGTPHVRRLGQKEFLEKLRHKLQEEVTEYLQEPSVEELCDIQTVVESLAEQHGFSKQDLDAAVEQKKFERGGFQKRLYLLSKE